MTLLKSVAVFAAVFLAAYFPLRGPLGPQPAAVLSYGAALAAFLAAAGAWSAFRGWVEGRPIEEIHGTARYFGFSTDHKVVGVQYLAATGVVFVLAGLMSLIMRAELARPGMQYLSYSTYNTVMGTHGIGMIVVALISIVGGLGNFALPLMIGARDMAFPRLNALSFWILPPAVLILLSSLFTGGFDFGWTAYPPLSVRGPQLGKLFFLIAFVTVGFSSILGGLNFLVTTLTMRAKGMSAFRIPIFVWSICAASIISLLATSVVASSLIMVVFDRVLGTSFFDPARGGNALIYQHLFWFYSHPAVYIMILPAFGVLLEVLPVHSRKPLFAYKLAAVSFIAIVVLSFVVWAHHLFTSGMWDALNIPFMITTELISVPTGVVFLSALGTLWLGSIRLRTPLLFALGVIFNFLIGGLTGIFLADVPTDLHFHDTWFVMAHFHFTIVGGTIFGFFAGFYHWFPKITGRMYDEALGKAHFGLFLAGFNAVFIPMFWLGSHGMRRRVADYPPEMGGVQLWISLAALIGAASALVFLYNAIRSWRRGPPASANPWEGRTLEWSTPSPPPHGNFGAAPEVREAPYEYGRA